MKLATLALLPALATAGEIAYGPFQAIPLPAGLTLTTPFSDSHFFNAFGQLPDTFFVNILSGATIPTGATLSGELIGGTTIDFTPVFMPAAISVGGLDPQPGGAWQATISNIPAAFWSSPESFTLTNTGPDLVFGFPGAATVGCSLTFHGVGITEGTGCTQDSSFVTVADAPADAAEPSAWWLVGLGIIGQGWRRLKHSA